MLAVRERIPGVLKAASELGPLKRPANADKRAFVRFEKDLAEVISRA